MPKSHTNKYFAKVSKSTKNTIFEEITSRLFEEKVG